MDLSSLDKHLGWDMDKEEIFNESSADSGVKIRLNTPAEICLSIVK
jgi:hypothetical protein